MFTVIKDKLFKPMLSASLFAEEEKTKNLTVVLSTGLFSLENNTVRRTVSEKINSFFMNPQREGWKPSGNHLGLPVIAGLVHTK
jgi:hypothetical protein